MIFLDINTNYNDHGGGIRTYHEQKIAWFRNHPEHSYYLVVPGAGYRERELAANVRRVEVYGVPLVGGYRLMFDYGRVYRLLRKLQPEVIEAGDPYLTGMFCLAGKRLRRFDGLVTSFYHTDTMRALGIERWSQAPGLLRPFRRSIGYLAARLFYRLQRSYDRTIVTSQIMEENLRREGVRGVAKLPFGVDPIFLSDSQRPGESPTRETPRKVRLLYSGRLCTEKGADLVEQVLPRLLQSEHVEATVIGRGVNDHPLCHYKHPRYRYLGYVGDRREVVRIYREHDVLLSPGPHETFGFSVLEALACGLVVVGANAGGTGELVGKLPAGFVFRPGDVDDFERVIRLALECDFAKQRRDAERLAREYGTSEQAIGRMIAFYEREATAAERPRHREGQSAAPARGIREADGNPMSGLKMSP